MEYSAGLYIEQEYRITWLRNIEYSEDSYSITCTAASQGAFREHFVEDLRREVWIAGAQSRRVWCTSFKFR